VLFAIDHVHRVTPAEEVPAAIVPFVERLCIAAVQASHPTRQIRLVGFHDQVVVSRHQAEGVAGPVVGRHDRAEQRQERLSIDVVQIDRAVVGTSAGDVIDAGRKLGSRSSRHAAKLRKTLAVR